MSGVPEQKVNKADLVKEFESLSLAYSSSIHHQEILGPVLFRLADNKENYGPASFELCIGGAGFFGKRVGEERNWEKKTTKINDLSQSYLNKAAVEAKYAPAQFELAAQLLRKAYWAAHDPVGSGTSSRSEQKEKQPDPQALLEQAADQSYAPAQFELAEQLLESLRDNSNGPKEQKAILEKVIKLLKDAAQAGDWEALKELGDIYSGQTRLLRSTVVVDYKAAADCYLAAARQGVFSSIQSLSEVITRPYDYFYDESFVKSFTERDVCYQALKQLAKEGYPEGQSELEKICVKARECRASGLKASSLHITIQEDGAQPKDQKASSEPVQPRIKWDRGFWTHRYDYAWRKKHYNPQFLGLRPELPRSAWTPVEAFEYVLEFSSDEGVLLLVVPDAEQKQAYMPACLAIYERRHHLFAGRVDQNLPTQARYKAIDHLAQPYLARAIEAKYAPAQFAQAKAWADDFNHDQEQRTKGQALLEQLAEQGYAPAQHGLARLLLGELRYSSGKPAQVSEAKEKITKIIACLESAVQAGDAWASSRLAQIYSGGVPSEAKGYPEIKAVQAVFAEQINHQKAAEYYLSSAKQGNSYDVKNLGYLVSKSSKYGQKEVTGAYIFYYQALKQLAEEGHPEALRQLDEIYQEIEKNREPSKDASEAPSSLRTAIQKDMNASKAVVAKYREAAKSAPAEPLIEEWEVEIWLKRYNKAWRAREYDLNFPEQTIEMLPSVEASVLKALPNSLDVVAVLEKKDEEREEAALLSLASSGSSSSPLPSPPSPSQPLSEPLVQPVASVVEPPSSPHLHKSSEIWLGVGFVLGAGLSIIALYFSGILMTLGALGLGPVAPFFLVGAVGGLLGAGLGFALFLLLRWKSQMGSAPGGPKKHRLGNEASGIDLDGLGSQHRPPFNAPSTADRRRVSKKKDCDDEPDPSYVSASKGGRN